MRNLLLFMLTLLCTTQVQAQTCNASASATVSGNVVTLTNTSTPTASTGIYTYYSINWGDGSTPTGVTTNAAQVHAYTIGGTYTIALMQSVLDSTVFPPTQCNDSTWVVVTVTGANQNYISGSLIVDSTSNIDSYKVWLITYDSATSILAAVDSVVITTMAGGGTYSFNNPAAGQYRTKAALHSGATSGTGHVPTYHTSSLMWNTATIINHTGGITSGKNITMQTGTLTSGPGFIGGNVNQGANKGTANGIAGLNVFLVNGSGNVIAFTETDANGAYSFSNIPVGAYSVAPENLNYATTPAVLNITAANASVTGVNFERSHSGKTIVPVASGIANVANNGLEYAIFPNPAADVVTISWNKQANANANISITDISGKTIYTGTSAMSANTTIDVSALQAGLYFLNVSSDAGSSTQKLTIQ